MARLNCRSYPSVEVINTPFEEWDLEPEAFDAVLAASSMHWIPSEVAYPKAHSALKNDGHLGTPEKARSTAAQLVSAIETR